MKIAIATDHRGRDLKYDIIDKIKNEFEIIDCSEKNTDTDDYPDFAFVVGKNVVDKDADFGVLICGTGIGMSIAANKVKGIRCALVSSVEEAKLAHEHNNANVLAFSSKLGADKIAECIKEYVTCEHNGENHIRRVKKIIDYENGTYNEL